MTRAWVLFFGLLLAACTTVGPRGADEHWRVVSWPGGATVSTSFGASCRTPCNVRIPDAPFDISIERPGYRTWAVHYDPAQPHELQQLARAPDRGLDAAGGAVLAGGELAARAGGLAGAPAIGGAAMLGALPYMIGPRVRRLEVMLEAQG